TARRAHNFGAVHQRRLGVAPVRPAAAEVLGQAALPANRSLGGLDTDQIAVGTDGIKQLSVHSRCAARPTAAVVGEKRPYLGRPELFGWAVPDVESVHKFCLLVSTHRVQAVSNDGRRRVTNTGLLIGPAQGRPGFGPGLEKARFGGNVGPLGPASLPA